MSHTLPLAEPLARGYQFYAFPLAIMATCPRSEDWVLSNFIQLAYDPRGEEADVPFCFFLHDHAVSPWLEHQRLSRGLVAMLGSEPHELARAALAGGYYVYLDLDEYYVPERRAFGTFHLSHDLLIHGYDDEAGAFRIYGFNDRNILTASALPYDAFLRAYTSPYAARPITERILLYKLVPDATYQLDVELVRSSLVEYLEGANTSRHFAQLHAPWDRHWGVDTYDSLTRYLEAFAAGSVVLNIRNLHVFYEHKSLMVRRLLRLAEVLDEDLSDALATARELEDQARDLRDRMLMVSFSGDVSQIADAATLLESVRDAEASMLRSVVDRLGTGR